MQLSSGLRHEMLRPDYHIQITLLEFDRFFTLLNKLVLCITNYLILKIKPGMIGHNEKRSTEYIKDSSH